MLIHTALLTFALLNPPISQTEAEPPDDYRESVRTVAELNERINVGEPVGPELFDALVKLATFVPMLAADPDARAQRARAQLNLVRSYLAEGDRASAVVVLDEAIRSEFGGELPVDQMGPSLAELHAERVAEFTAKGTATIAVSCQVPCRVYIDEHPAKQRTDGLFLGVYRVWVEPSDPEAAGMTQLTRVNLDKPDEVTLVEFAPFPKPDKVDEAPVQEPRPKRVMPKEGEVGMIALGAGLATAGALLLGFNPSGNHTQTALGATMTGVGATSLLVGGITLGYDEVRLGKWRGRQATVSWQFRF